MHYHGYDSPVRIGIITLAKKKELRIVAVQKAELSPHAAGTRHASVDREDADRPANLIISARKTWNLVANPECDS
jgi:hypothetical protein